MEKIKDLKLKKEIFGIEPNDCVLNDAINTARCGLRQGTYSTKTKNYTTKMNRKERRLALLSALSYKNKEKAIVVVDNIDLAGNKTKDMLNALKSLDLTEKKVLIVMDELTENVILASRNLQNVLLMEPVEINVLDIVNADVLLMNKQAVAEIEEALK